MQPNPERLKAAWHFRRPKMIVDFRKMSARELEVWSYRYHLAGWQVSVKLLGERNVMALRLLSTYALTVSQYIRCKSTNDWLCMKKLSARLSSLEREIKETGLPPSLIGWV